MWPENRRKLSLSKDHIQYMQRCLQLAKNGSTSTSPNPMVGCVIVHQDQIIGEGWHRKAGEAHAEVRAINSVAETEKLKDSTLYVSLEPCSHHGRTPPCADLIIEKKIPRVVIACRDKNSVVNGRGIERLEKNGVEVIEGVMEQEAIWLNKRFFTFHSKKRSYVVLKWAQTSDGFFDKKRANGEKGINWITQPETRTFVHWERSKCDAILVGSQTVINDNPALTLQEVYGENPIRLILDPNLETPENARVYEDENYRIFTLKKTDRRNAVQLKKNESFLKQVLRHSYVLGNLSMMVEGGARTIQSFIDEDLWDEALVLQGATTFGQGLKAPQIPRPALNYQQLGKDRVLNFLNL